MKVVGVLSGVFSVAILAASMASVAYGQQAPVAAATPQTPPDANQVARARRQETLRLITDRISQATGLRVVADSQLGRQQVTAPDDAVTASNLDEYLTRLAGRLPGGAFVIKIYLPPSAEGRRFTPDAIAQIARAQRDLLGPPAPNTVQIQGKVLTTTEAAPVIKTLGLEPVYVLTTRQAPSNVRFAPGGGIATTFSGTGMMDDLAKQLGVAKVSDIPNGTYKVNVPGPDGTPREATVEVDNTDGKRRVRVMLNSTGPVGVTPL